MDPSQKPVLMASHLVEDIVRLWELPTFAERGELSAVRDARALGAASAAGLLVSGDKFGVVKVCSSGVSPRGADRECPPGRMDKIPPYVSLTGKSWRWRSAYRPALRWKESTGACFASVTSSKHACDFEQLLHSSVVYHTRRARCIC